MVPSVCSITEDACSCPSIHLHLHSSTAPINNAKGVKGTTAMFVTGTKLIMKSITSLFMAIFPSSDWWRSFSSTNSWCQEFKSLLQQDTRSKSNLTVVLFSLVSCEKLIPRALLDSHSYLGTNSSSSTSLKHSASITSIVPLHQRSSLFLLKLKE